MLLVEIAVVGNAVNINLDSILIFSLKLGSKLGEKADELMIVLCQ